MQFMAWALVHSAWQLYLLALFNAHDYTMSFVTKFSTEIFSLLNSVIYFHKAVQELQRTHATLSFAAFLYSVIGAAGTFLLAVSLSSAEKWRPLLHRYMRLGIAEYAAAISIVFFSGISHAGELATLDGSTLPVSASFRPTEPARSVFLVRFWELPVAWVFAAMIPGLIITVLFFFDHEISSIICSADRYGVRKPGGFAWDIALLGTTNALCGVLGLPPANGLLPQAPLHSESLLHDSIEKVERRQTAIDHDEKSPTTGPDGGADGDTVVRRRVYEQRWSPFLQAGGILLFISPPFMHVLGLVPVSVLAGLFLFMGEQSLVVK